MSHLIGSGELIKEARKSFKAMDADSNGWISKEELELAFQQTGQRVDSEQVGQIMDQVDVDKNGELNYSEFVTSQMCHMLTVENLKKVFQFLDTEGYQLLSLKGLKEASKRRYLKTVWSDSQLEKVLEETGLTNDANSHLTFSQFCLLMGIEDELLTNSSVSRVRSQQNNFTTAF